MVSVIITTHNRANLLLGAIESVRKQTYKDMEIIVVDDASEDNTKEICKDMADINYIRIEKEVSKGGNYARNIGIKASKGEYIAFLDDDDEWYSEKIELQLKRMNSNKEIGMVYTDLYVDTGVKFLNYKVAFSKEVQGDIVQKKLFWKPICTTSAMLVKRSILVEIGLFDENIRYWQEYELSLRIIQKCKIALLSVPLVKYRKSIHDKKQLTNNYDKWEEAVEYINKKHQNLFNMLDDNGKKLKLETYYREAGYRTAAIGNKILMKEYYRKAYTLTRQPEYWIRWKFGISRQDTVYLEILIKKLIYLMKKR